MSSESSETGRQPASPSAVVSVVFPERCAPQIK
jgi:hypothetical protein